MPISRCDVKLVGYSLQRRFFRLDKRIAGITRRCRFHDLRHTFASRLASGGVPLQFIARALGHKSVTTTERYARSDSSGLDTVLGRLRRKAEERVR
jgi:integrase